MKNSNPSTGTIYLNNSSDSTKNSTIKLDDFPNGRSEIEYGDGRKYFGFINKRNLAPHGEGTALFPDTSKYEGNW